VPECFRGCARTGRVVSEATNARAAATVILLRPMAPTGFQVFLTRRPEAMRFLGGMYCFPGGGVSKEDCSPRMVARCSGVSPQEARKIIGAQFRPHAALGFWIAAIRELFEEVGILLTVGDCGRPMSIDPIPSDRLAEKHAALIAKSLSFTELLESENLYCDASALAYFSHWQTPAQNSLRFDTRFFLAVLPPAQTPLPSSYEVIHSLWLTPDQAIQLFERAELPLIFPTFATLRSLADFETLESLLEEFSPTSAAASVAR
jgi:8-oxo-dGTP pyrophosphatase MutT (NUDIX family)